MDAKKKEFSRQKNSKIIAVSIFSIAFALLEAMIVVYLGQVIELKYGQVFTQLPAYQNDTLVNLGFIVFTSFKLLSFWQDIYLEILREMATLVILSSVAYLSGKNWWQRLAFFLLSFGLWDIFYYFWLYLVIGWPKTLLDLDILFLIPVPWVAPVIVPLFISLVMIVVSFHLLTSSSHFLR